MAMKLDINQHLRPTLEGFRNKLLDLTSRNSLLNLSLKSQRTARLLRFIDCDLQAVLNGLASGRQYSLSSLTEPAKEKQSSLGDAVLEAAIEKARLEDPLYKQILSDSQGDPAAIAILAQADDRLRATVLEGLGNTSKEDQTDRYLAAWAEQQGVDPSYSLPVTTESKAHHGSLRVLLAQPRMERVAETVRKQAQSSIEETGNNILYLAFGCLEWIENSKSYFAPLILLPAELTKTSNRGGSITFYLGASDDAPVANVTLKERLRRDFGIELPMPDLNSDALELHGYLAAVAASVSELNGWHVHSYLNLALFNFSGLGLYEDLDPDVIQASSLVRQLLAAEISDEETVDEAAVIAEDIHVDQPEIAKQVPVLIAQADASQFAAVAEVMAGRSMVIEGPPGTGKSQTITNIIANALYKGQRVLFVAEKKVALDVVLNRLSDAGLRPYCLRIESDKANKRQVYDELAERIERNTPANPRREGTHDAFNQLRRELNHFSALLNQPHGQEEQSQHDLLWQELRLRCQLTASGVDPMPHQVEIVDACANSKQRVELNSQCMDELAKLLAGLNTQDLSAVFAPLVARPADALGRDALLDQAAQWAHALQALVNGLSPIKNSQNLSIGQLRHQARASIEHASRLPEPLPSEAEALLPVLCAPAVAGIARSLLEALQADTEVTASVSKCFVRTPDPLPSAISIQTLVANLSQWRLGSIPMPQEHQGREQLRERLSKAAQLADRLDVLLETSSSGLSLAGFNPASLQRVLQLVEFLNRQPEWVLRQRGETIWRCDLTRARTLVDEDNTLQKLRLQLKLDQALHAGCVTSGLATAIETLQLCCERGLGEVLPQPNASQQWGQRLDEAQRLLEAVQADLQKCLPGEAPEVVTLGQALSLPELVRSVLALEPDALAARATPLWTADLRLIEQALEGERDLNNRELALQNAGLNVRPGHTPNVLREAADQLEKKPLLKSFLNKMSGTKGRAVNLAREIGAANPEQRASALRDVANVIELRQIYGPGWQRQRFSVDLPSERLLLVAKQLQELKALLDPRDPAQVLTTWLKNSPVAELEQTLNVFDQGLMANLEALVGHDVWPTAVCDHTLDGLRETLSQGRQDQSLLAKAEPFACWARAAGVQQGEAMVEWLQQVERYSQREQQFPRQDLQSLLSGGLEVDQMETVLAAVEHWRVLTDDPDLSSHCAALLAVDQASLSQALLMLQHQLAPSVQELLAEADLLPADANQQPLQVLASGLKEAAQGYQVLLQQWLDAGLRPDAQLQELVHLPVDLALAHRRKEDVIQALASFQQQAGAEVADTAPGLLREVMGWIVGLRQAGLPTELEDRCLQQGSGQFIGELRCMAQKLAEALHSEHASASAFISTAQPQAEVLSDGAISDLEDLQVDGLQTWLAQIAAHRDQYPTWIKRHQLLEQLPADGLRELAERLMASNVEGGQWSRVYRWNLVRSQLRQMAQAIPDLQRLRSNEQVARRERFQRMEDELRLLDQAAVVAAIHRDPGSLPEGMNKGPRGEFTEMGLILHECRKQKRHRPLRHLFQYAGESLRGLKPCWMMSPGTLASLVPRETFEQFDLVIVDEASQMPPERAFGLISRARQCVVVGDPKQLPPTSFFKRTASADETEAESDVDSEVLDEESILDLCTKTFNPVRRLKWHYRSRHGSLIAFSNKHFYNNELVVFPSCDLDFAIHRHLVEDARYSKGVNLPEVKHVCDVVIEQLDSYPDRSLGVVAMNDAQASEIGEQLEMLSLHHDELRRRLALKDTSAELFVKALEKVQGDERDTIVISCTYGPPEPGAPVAMSLGPIIQEGGHRRLNVLFTRAKRAIELVTSIESHQIKTTATSRQGLHAFRDYLKYVESQSLETGRPSGREPDSPFEVVVAEAIQRHGFDVDCQVGVANYFIDLAIRHPQHPDIYLLGVECDGATYHSARAARDRDKYRQSVLEGLGWQIYRIWSTDWFENAELETRKLMVHLEQILGKSTV